MIYNLIQFSPNKHTPEKLIVVSKREFDFWNRNHEKLIGCTFKDLGEVELSEEVVCEIYDIEDEKRSKEVISNRKSEVINADYEVKA